MAFFIVSFFAGVLTVLAPCILPVLPIVIGKSLDGEDKYKPLIITGSLAIGIILFTLILKASTALIAIPQYVWSYISGGIIILFGLVTVFPHVWEKISMKLHLSYESGTMLQKASTYSGTKGDVLIGLSLGPVFSSCSPTYFLILATVLPQNYGTGIVYLIAYALGLSSILLLIAYLGQKIVKKLNLLSDPNGKFKKILGVMFILVGVFIMSGLDKKVQTFILDTGFLDVTKLEQKILTDPMKNDTDKTSSTKNIDSQKNYPPYTEIANPSGYVNTDPITIGELIEKKIVMVDFMTYSCINCIRTFPYLNAWYEKYHDAGFEIIGIHTPEFAFEHDIQNVQNAMKKYGIQFPVVLDNDYATWNAYRNNYWPRKYLIDINGNVVFDHIGEGGYEETEQKIQELLRERSEKLSSGTPIPTTLSAPKGIVDVRAESPETYFGAARNQYLANGNSEILGTQSLKLPDTIKTNKLYLEGTWDIQKEFASPQSSSTAILYNYNAQAVYIVASATQTQTMYITLDGNPLTKKIAGEDVQFDPRGNSFVEIQDEKLYSLINHSSGEHHTLKLEILEPHGLRAYTFTFG